MEIRAKSIRTFDEFLENSPNRILAIYGGAGSGKSYQVALWLCIQFLSRPKVKILCTRKTFPALRITSLELIRSFLSDWGVLGNLVEENKSEHTFRTGKNLIIFKSLDDPEKIKSFEADIVWVEESTELSYEDYNQLDLRLTRTKSNVRIILTFNPIDAYHWCVEKIVQGNDPQVAVHHSTYRDNPFLDDSFVQRLKDLEKKDRNYYRIYALGEPGVLEHIVYSNYHIEDSDVWSGRAKGVDCYGLDFGFNDPCALVSIKTDEQRTYAMEMLYKTGLTARALAGEMHQMGVSHQLPIFCDSARPEMIEELHRGYPAEGIPGFNALPVDKGKDSVKMGIDLVKQRDLRISSDSLNLVKEIRGYKYLEDKNGRVLDVPVDAFNHIVDALRYAIYGSRNRAEPNIRWL